jgi:YD repeat-containing protein
LSKTADPFFSAGGCAPTPGNAFLCGATKVSYTYTPSGKRQTMSDATGVWTYNYDPVNRLIHKENDQVLTNVDWGYDAAGNIVGIATNNHAALQNYAYDALNRLQTVTGTSFGEAMKAD